MSLWDDRILEYIRDSDTESASVGELTDSDVVHVTNSHVSDRCKKLAEEGLLTPLGNGVYTITDIGEAYLDGEYNAEEGAYVDVSDGNPGPTASETSDI